MTKEIPYFSLDIKSNETVTLDPLAQASAVLALAYSFVAISLDRKSIAIDLSRTFLSVMPVKTELCFRGISAHRRLGCRKETE